MKTVISGKKNDWVRSKKRRWKGRGGAGGGKMEEGDG